MDSIPPATSSFGSVAKAVTKFLRFRRNSANITTAHQSGPIQGDELHKLKLSKSRLEEFSQVLPKGENEMASKNNDDTCQIDETLESLVANLFASISAIKAAYAQIQVAQTPYDPDTIQSADRSVVTELKHISQLKYSYLKNQIGPPPAPQLAAQIQEHRNLIKTYQITTNKLESDITYKDSEIVALQARLMDSNRRNRALESRLHPGHLLASLHGLHLSGLDSTHFLAAIRYAARSIQSFAELMIHEMESAGWDLDAAARSIQPDTHNKPGHSVFAFESFISQKLFSDFHCRDFGQSHPDNHESWEPEEFFTEFSELKMVKTRHYLQTHRGRSSAFGKFCRGKYMTLVHPKMEASFFGNLDHRGLISSGRGLPESDFFAGFAEMARRVWLLHCLFFSFGQEMETALFQFKRGCRFSEVYMESVLKEVYVNPTVGFTVMPGFRVGKTVIQCRVYLLGSTGNGRS